MDSWTNSEIETLEDVKSDFSNRVIPCGTRGFIVEAYDNPRCYAVDLAISAPELVGGVTYENIILFPQQIRILDNTTP